MRLAHPRAKFAPTTDSGRVLGHPGLEVFRADPARVQLAERRNEGLGFGLQLWGGLYGIGSSYGVEKRP